MSLLLQRGPDLEKNIVLVSGRQPPYKEDLAMLTPDQIHNIHRLHWAEKWPVRKIARHLHIGRRTIAKYLDVPAPAPTRRDRVTAGIQAPFHSTIRSLFDTAIQKLQFISDQKCPVR